VPVREIRSGQIAAIALKLTQDTKEWIGSKKIRKGMVLVKTPSPKATWSFSAEVWTLDGKN